MIERRLVRWFSILLVLAVSLLTSNSALAQTCPDEPSSCESCTAPRVCARCWRIRSWDCGQPLGIPCTAREEYDCEPCSPNPTDPSYIACTLRRGACESSRAVAQSCRATLGEGLAAINRIKGELDAAGQRLDTTRREVSEAAAALQDRVSQIQGIESRIEALRRRLAEIQATFDRAIDSLRGFGNQDIILYDITTGLNLSYNARVGTAWYQVKLPRGLSLDRSSIKAALRGNLAPPQIDPLTLVGTHGLIDATRSDGYDAWAHTARGRGGNMTSYIASKRFVENVSLERIANDAVVAVFTGGATLAGSEDALRDQLALEWADIVSWLKGVGIREGNALAARSVRILFERHQIEVTDLPSATFESGNVDYRYRITVKAGQELLVPLEHLGIEVFHASSIDVVVPHQAFSIRVLNGQQQSVDEVTTEFRTAMLNGPSIDPLAIQVPEGTLPFSPSALAPFRDFEGTDSVRGILAEMLRVGELNLDRYHVGNLMFDLTASNIAREIERRLKSLAAGNQGSARVRKLIIDGRSLVLRLEVDLVHRHSIGNVDALVTRLRQKLEDVSLSRSLRVQAGVAQLGNLRNQQEVLNRTVQQLRTAEADARNAYESVRSRLREACSVQVPGVGRVQHPACSLL